MYWKPWRATDLFQARAIVLHSRMSGQPGSDFAKDSGSVRVLWFSDAIVDPLALSSCGNNSGTLQVSEVAADLGLIDFQHFDKEAHANLVFADKIYQAQTGSICQCFEEKSDVVFVVCHAVFFVCDW